MSNSSLFKQAIAEAKSVREAAIINAKQSLEESITPEFKSMLATRLQEMEEDDLEEAINFYEAEEPEEELPEENPEEELPIEEPEEGEEAPEVGEEEPEIGIEGEEDDREIGDLSVEEFKTLIQDLITQVGAEGPEEEPEMDLGADMDAGEEPEMPEDGIEGMEGAPEGEEGEEEIDLDELLREMSDEAEEKKEEPKEKAELQEALKTISKLRKDLQEVNLLNAKLLYVSKVLKATNLTESQKVNVISAFDKAENVREAKLIYQTVSESVTPKKVQTPLRESKLGSASRATGKPNVRTQVLTEVDESVRRMQKLAGIITD